MVSKQAVLETIQTLPESAGWTEITDALLALLAREGATSEYARLYRSQLTPQILEEYANPKFEVSLESMIAELELRHGENTP